MFDDSGSPPASVIAATELNPLFHEPARLALLAVLAPAEYVDFSTLVQLTGASKSALSKHLSALSDAGVVDVSKGATDKRERRVAFSVQGRSAFNSYLAHLERIVRNARQ